MTPPKCKDCDGSGNYGLSEHCLACDGTGECADWLERAAIMEHDGKMTRDEAEQRLVDEGIAREIKRIFKLMGG